MKSVNKAIRKKDAMELLLGKPVLKKEIQSVCTALTLIITNRKV